MSKFVDLPNGDSIRADTIFAVRLGDAKARDELYQFELKPRVIIDFGLSSGENMFGGNGRGNCVILNCDSDEERNDLAVKIRGQL